jgi:hypothetical protein
VQGPFPDPRSLAWTEDGELHPQDRFDLLQGLMTSEESHSVQVELVAAMERLPTDQLCLQISVAQSR